MRYLLPLILFVMFSPLSADAGDVKNGEAIFKKRCMGCHRLTEGVKMGPSMLGVTKRRSEEWLNNWLLDPKAMIEAGDPVAVELLEKYKKRMPVVKAMQDEKSRKDVISFLKKVDAESGDN